MKINTYGITMKGLRKASGATMDYNDDSKYDEIFYNRETGEIWTVFQVSMGRNSWTQYDDPKIVKVCNTSRHMTMQAIADAIRDTLDALTRCA